MRTLFSVLTILLSIAGLTAAHADPFNGQHEVPADTGTVLLMPRGFINELAHAQMQLSETISGQFASVHTSGSIAAMLTILLLAFFYGVIHAAGPGHGKTVVASYFVANDSAFSAGIFTAGLISILQGVTAIAIVFVISLVLHSKELQVANRGALIDCVSYGIVMALGVVLFWRAATGRGCGHSHGPMEHSHAGEPSSDRTHDRHAHHDHAAIGHDKLEGERKNFQRLLVAAVGVAPCASAIIIMLFALANDAMGLGIAAVMALSLGMAITVSAVGMLSIVARRLVMRLTKGPGLGVQRLEQVLRLLGSAAIIGFAGLLMIGSLANF